MGGNNAKHTIPKDTYKHKKNLSTGTCSDRRATTQVSITPICVTYELKHEGPTASNTLRNTTRCENMLPNFPKKEPKRLNIPSVSPKKAPEKSFLMKVAIAPENFKSMKDFLKHWPIWKEQFISYIHLIDEKKLKCDIWGCILLDRIGVVRYEISNEFAIDNIKNKDSYLMLIAKLDAYYSFYTTKRLKSESIDKYVNRLKGMNLLKDTVELYEALKKKILQEIDEQCKDGFIAVANSMLLDFEYSYISHLTLKEIIEIWKIYEESISNTTNNKNENCNKCGKIHDIYDCPAATLECNKCKERGHIASMCPLSYINNCKFCGGNHKKHKCPAYGETCSKCHKLNHYAWKCSKVTYIKNCKFCGLAHAANRNTCIANTVRCSICHRVGHFEVKCPNMK